MCVCVRVRVGGTLRRRPEDGARRACTPRPQRCSSTAGRRRLRSQRGENHAIVGTQRKAVSHSFISTRKAETNHTTSTVETPRKAGLITKGKKWIYITRFGRGRQEKETARSLTREAARVARQDPEARDRRGLELGGERVPRQHLPHRKPNAIGLSSMCVSMGAPRAFFFVIRPGCTPGRQRSRPRARRRGGRGTPH